MAVGMATPISVVIPVGPRPEHSRWLDEAATSVCSQMDTLDEMVIVENGTDLESERPFCPFDRWRDIPAERVWKSPWPLGVPVAFNIGVGLAFHEHVLLMGSDDVLLDGCLDACRKSIEDHNDPLGWYYLGVEYSDGRTQNTPCHASVITKALWEFTGGFPPESAVGACDTILISILLHNHSKAWTGDFHQVSTKPLYWWRQHPDQETRRRKSSWGSIAKLVRDVLSVEWKP